MDDELAIAQLEQLKQIAATQGQEINAPTPKLHNVIIRRTLQRVEK
jgi:hypothetical protein